MDMLRKKHGTVSIALAGKDPKFEKFEHLFAVAR